MIHGRMVRAGDGAVVVPRARRTAGPLERMRGLLFRPPLLPGEGLVIDPCNSVHTFAMGYAIDILFLARDGRVRRIVEALAPWRMAGDLGAAMTLELLGGASRQLHIQPDDRLLWQCDP